MIQPGCQKLKSTLGIRSDMIQIHDPDLNEAFIMIILEQLSLSTTFHPGGVKSV